MNTIDLVLRILVQSQSHFAKKENTTVAPQQKVLALLLRGVRPPLTTPTLIILPFFKAYFHVCNALILP